MKQMHTGGHEVWIEAEYCEWFVEYELGGERTLYEAEDEKDARDIARAVGGQLKVRTVFETVIADAPDE